MSGIFIDSNVNLDLFSGSEINSSLKGLQSYKK